MNGDGGGDDDDMWKLNKKQPVPSSTLACIRLHNCHLDRPPGSNAPLTYTEVLQREKTRDLSGHQHLQGNPLLVKSGEIDLLLGASLGRRSGPW